MPIIAFDPANRPIFSIPFHFDVAGHKIALSTFVETSVEYERLFEALNQELFSGELQYKLYVFAPEPGSFKSTLGVVIIAGFSALTATIFGDFGEGFVEGLTGKPTHEWGQEIGNRIRQELSTESRSDAIPDDEIESAISTEILVNSSERFLEKRTSELAQIGLSPEDYPESFAAKNAFYDALELNPQIKSVGFGDSPETPVSREDFSLRVTPVRPRDDSTWEFETRKIFVTSPNWDQNDKQRGWKGRDSKGSFVFFTIYDPHFWLRYENGEVNSGTIDELVVQFAVKVENGRRKNRIVLNVISYNDDDFGAEMSARQLWGVLEKSGVAPIRDNGPTFFEED
ncbi:hypothetical protein BD830_10252 [Maritimibacter alkaliphilus HTCC2654]|uniref:Uncharacterized protein n=1 Tax=Maritimibacter alkaliphilus HTCC2654 TaxID=314271 RepID=A3VM06_9RHOB|nr:hypothetical protein [Maritimibacter alkaliphilus]EAQ10698.1 hypothetical protein RB2654_11879 [Rhodobacterales bacterium HTCC2654] [Maritimibacter alkaliphilus HTCC2654]TYP83965.1 hypothetical protein BD830_10252 [Maritimibacter alkaliphilus HTCC2654]